MKHGIIIILVLSMLFLLSACGESASDTVDTMGGNAQETITPAETETLPTSATETEEIVTETEEETTAEPAPAFDNSWASNDFEKQLPPIPFADWSVDETNSDSNSYRIMVTNVPNTDVIAYGELLMSVAFTEVSSVHDHPYEYTIFADNTNGYGIFYSFSATDIHSDPVVGALYILITAPQ